MKLFISLILASGIWALGLAQSLNFDNLYYLYSDTEGEVELTYPPVSAPLYSGEVVVPETITADGNTLKVTAVGPYAFANCMELASVSLPSTIKTIERNAFENCTALETIVLPEGVTEIEEGTFYNCTSLKELNIDHVVCLGRNALSGCEALSKITLPSTLITIGDGCFKNCTSLQSVVVPEGLQFLGSGIWDGCRSLISVKLPEQLSTIPDYAFRNCTALQNINFPKSLTSIGEYAFNGCDALEAVHFPNAISEIGAHAFSFCSSIKELEIKGDNTILRNYAFGNCLALTSVDLQGVPDIEDYCFFGDVSLAKVILGEDTYSIGRSAFGGCEKITYIESYAHMPPYLANGSFSDAVYKGAVLTVPKSCYIIYKQTPPWSYFTTIKEMPDASVDGILTETPNFTINGLEITIAGEHGPMEIFNISGISVCRQDLTGDVHTFILPAPGLYIVKTSGASFKIRI